MSKALDWISDLLFPNRCPFCDCFIPWNAVVCESCRRDIVFTDCCPKCGHSECECRYGDFEFDGCISVAEYAGKCREAILSLKHGYGFNAAKFLAPRLSEKLKEQGFAQPGSIITAVPMTYKRKNPTGYNQSEYIAKLLSKSLGLPTDFGLLGKRSSSPAQHELSAAERREAAKQAYFAKKGSKRAEGKTVILCDDIITTGSTLSECARILKSCGAAAVYCAVLTETKRGPEGGNENVRA